MPTRKQEPKQKVNKAEIIRQRARQVMAYRKDNEALAEATIIRKLIDDAEDGIRGFIDTPQHIKGLLPQCLGQKIKAHLSNYCAHRALFELFKKPSSVSLAEEWVSAAEDCAKEEFNYPFAKSAAQSVAATKKRTPEQHAEIVVYLDKLRETGISIGDANTRTRTHFDISVRQIQSIRKQLKRS